MSQGAVESVNIEFFDSNLFVGRPMWKIEKPICTTQEVISELDESGISKALVWHIDQHSNSPVVGNKTVIDVIKDSPRLFGCWTILPPQTGEVIGPDFFTKMGQQKIRALRAFPDRQNFLLNRQVFGSFLDEVSERGIPLMLSLSGFPSSIGWKDVYKLMEEYPQLTCILCDTGVWLTDRYTRPLLENYPNLRLDTSYVSLGARVVEEIVEKYGAHRLVFGTGLPMRYPEAPMLQLLHAEISHEDKALIASGNLEKLIAEVKL